MNSIWFVLGGLGLLGAAGIKAIVTRKILFKGGREVAGAPATIVGAILVLGVAVALWALWPSL